MSLKQCRVEHFEFDLFETPSTFIDKNTWKLFNMVFRARTSFVSIIVWFNNIPCANKLT